MLCSFQNSLYNNNMIKTLKKHLTLAIIIIILTQSYIFADDQLQDVNLQLRWEHQFQFAGYYAALWNGYYEDAGFNVNILSGIDNEGHVMLAPKEVAEGRADFGVGAVDILFAIDEGQDLTIVSSIFQKSAVAYYMLESTTFNSVSDFSKLNVARRRNDLLDIELQAMLISEGLKPSGEAMLSEDTILSFEDLLSGRYDVIPEYLGKVKYQAQQSGHRVKMIRPVDFGIDFYGDSLFTSSEYAQNSPEDVEAFRKATIKGWEYALDNPQKIATKIIDQYYANSKDRYKTYSYNIFQAERVNELTLYPIVQTGNINVFRWETMTETLKELNLITDAVNMNDHIFDYRKIQEESNAKKAKYYRISTVFMIAVLIIAYIIYVTKKNTDLTDEIAYRKRSEEHIKRSNERYQTLFNSSFLGITVTNRKGKILQVNDKWAEMTGYGQDELINMPIFDILDKDSAKSGKEAFKTLRDGTAKSIELERCYTRKNGTRFWGQLFMTSIIDPETEDQAFLGMVLDITRRKFEKDAVKRAEERFREIINEIAEEVDEKQIILDPVDTMELYDGKARLSLKLEKINLELGRMFKKELDENRKKEAILIYQARLAAMGEMIANIAHQWRQPLNNLGILLSNVEDAYKFNELDEEEMSKTMGRAKLLIRNMSETIDDFRDFLKPQKQQEAFNVCETIHSILNMLKENFEFNDIAVDLVCETDIEIHGSKNHYGQSIFNVLNNAIDSLCESSTMDKKIRIHVQDVNDQVVLTISDNGVGIQNKDIAHIFDPYFSTKEANKGTGLGLYMVKNIIEGQMNGSIALVNYSAGATFEISVPKIVLE